MDIKQLTYFLTIAEEKSITKASEKLHIAQPHLSQQLKLLEEELNVKLIERTTRKFQVTDAGKRLWHRSKQIIELMESTVKELKDFNEGMEGTLSIGTISSAGDILLPQRIYSFNKKYPKINFEIQECSTNEILELLKSGVIEIGIIRTPLNSEIYESINLPIEPMVAASSNSFYWNNKGKICLNELAGKPLLVHRRYEKMIIELCKQTGFNPRILCKIEDTRSILLLADTGMGIGIVPKDWIELIPNTNLNYKEINEPSLDTNTTIVWMKDQYLSSAAKHFLQTFKA
ncbi:MULTISPECIES: LysR family transcriptional regulator [Clostridium]|uniref:HTH-type transcriptional regulator CatM n=3 Tax=Clostridium TaxID=1485 RepID=D8GUH2_CLOLD|nr:MULTISPECIES: LysR family transcriptional regulator [Clostridium]ADK14835.1 predicted transcriptional regulator, LysR family [Clostridium ljungdahlii DSM 13528]AGY78081.1 LysR family transcriptional regulator [Clostridium autoethanogenum DSM 10061]ALU38215.1 Transcriptional regulator LysR family [Clostridium autoethanogenum DSM 10061]OAA87831.1 HTH-type transcriptional regulator CatM [Clostridium ljungdahlii DSM 13528]OVY50978.1 HTH-type transcriptional regulator CatM [Clostridium autoethan